MAKTDYIVRAIPSSFVFSDMKLMTDKGAGEAKLFVGPKSKETEIDDFFRFGSGIKYRFDKKNMLEYLLQVKMEYVFQRINQYKVANIEKWNEINHIISEMSEADFYVKLEKFVDNSRYYVRADDEIFKKTFRKMVVPKLTDLILTKDDETQETILRLRVNYDFAKGSVDVDEEDPEERNKRLFRYWMGLQVKPEGDSDAGKPYSSSSIDQYVSNVANTPLSSMPERSVFYTTDARAVQVTLEILDNSEKKNNTQRSAIRKYIEYISELVSDEDCEEVFNHRLFGMHIKEKNNALSSEHPHVCIGWSNMGDLSDISSKEELSSRYDKFFDKNPRGKGQDVGQVWRFLNDVQIGDYVIFAENSVFHIGRVESDYCYDDTVYPEQSEDMMNSFDGAFERVTFHPEYSYAQFVGTYKPVMDEDGESIKYNYVPGPFMRMYVEAIKSARTDNPQPYLLLIEEINRAKVAAVFGDVFQLLDRDDNGVSEYEIQASEDIRRYLAKELNVPMDSCKHIRIPDNMYIWATMNSADQGVFPMDTAFKRRWNFEYLGINDNEDEIKGIGKLTLAGMDEPIEWNRLRKAINAKMSSGDFKINEDKLMGPFFLSKKVIASDENGEIIDREKFIKAFKSKVIMYLYEDAVKQGKHRFFDGCPDTGKYSSVCDAFKTMGLAIFGPTFKESFYDKED